MKERDKKLTELTSRTKKKSNETNSKADKELRCKRFGDRTETVEAADTAKTLTETEEQRTRMEQKEKQKEKDHHKHVQTSEDTICRAVN